MERSVLKHCRPCDSCSAIALQYKDIFEKKLCRGMHIAPSAAEWATLRAKWFAFRLARAELLGMLWIAQTKISQHTVKDCVRDTSA